MEFKDWLENEDPFKQFLLGLLAKYPFATIDGYETDNKIELMELRLPKDMQGQGYGTAIIKAIQEYAQSAGKPIKLVPEPGPRKKKKLFDFYKQLGFVKNTGRHKDYRLSSMFGQTMYWRPEVQEVES